MRSPGEPRGSARVTQPANNFLAIHRASLARCGPSTSDPATAPSNSTTRARAVAFASFTPAAAVHSTKRSASPAAGRGEARSDEQPEDLAHETRVGGQAVAQGEGEGAHPLADRHLGKHAIDQMCGGVGHAPASAGRAERAPLAQQRDQPVLAARIAVNPQESARRSSRAGRTSRARSDRVAERVLATRSGISALERPILHSFRTGITRCPHADTRGRIPDGSLGPERTLIATSGESPGQPRAWVPAGLATPRGSLRGRLPHR